MIENKVSKQAAEQGEQLLADWLVVVVVVVDDVVAFTGTNTSSGISLSRISSANSPFSASEPP